MTESNENINKTMLAAEANLLAQGYVIQNDIGKITFTDKGISKVETILNAMSEEDLTLVAGYFKNIVLEFINR
jgi:hypothetical protein